MFRLVFIFDFDLFTLCFMFHDTYLLQLNLYRDDDIVNIYI